MMSQERPQILQVLCGEFFRLEVLGVVKVETALGLT